MSEKYTAIWIDRSFFQDLEDAEKACGHAFLFPKELFKLSRPAARESIMKIIQEGRAVGELTPAQISAIAKIARLDKHGHISAKR